MRYFMVLALALLSSPAWAMDEFEAHDAYVKCFTAASAKLIPDWCHDSDQLAEFAHQSCLRESAAIAATAQVRTPKQALQNAQLSGQLVMFDQLRKYKASPGCNK